MIATLNTFFNWLILAHNTEKDAYGTSFLVSYLIGDIIIMAISFFLIRYGVRLLKKTN